MMCKFSWVVVLGLLTGCPIALPAPERAVPGDAPDAGFSAGAPAIPDGSADMRVEDAGVSDDGSQSAGDASSAPEPVDTEHEPQGQPEDQPEEPPVTQPEAQVDVCPAEVAATGCAACMELGWSVFVQEPGAVTSIQTFSYEPDRVWTFVGACPTQTPDGEAKELTEREFASGEPFYWFSGTYANTSGAPRTLWFYRPWARPWTSSGWFGTLTGRCGDGVADQFGGYQEECDDGNNVDGDGCSAACTVELGFDCPPPYTACRVVVCGDGRWDPFKGGQEQCEDGNTIDGDGCSATCTLDVGTSEWTALPLPLGITHHDFDLRSCAGCSGESWYEITLAPRQRLHVQVETDFEGRLSIVAIDEDSGREYDVGASASLTAGHSTELVTGNDNSVPRLLRIKVRGLPQRRLSFTLNAQVEHSNAPCGDGSVTEDEQCDDGNAMDGDGCTSDCVLEPGYACNGQPSSCQLAPMGDLCSAAPLLEDGSYSLAGYTAEPRCSAIGACAYASRWWQIDVPDGQTLWIGVTTEDVLRGRVALYDASLGTCDGAGRVQRAHLAFGRAEVQSLSAYGVTVVGGWPSTPVLVEVSDLEVNPSSVTFTLQHQLSPTGCGDHYRDKGYVARHHWVGSYGAPEDCDDGNRVDGDGCSASCKVEPSWSCGDGPCVRSD